MKWIGDNPMKTPLTKQDEIGRCGHPSIHPSINRVDAYAYAHAYAYVRLVLSPLCRFALPVVCLYSGWAQVLLHICMYSTKLYLVRNDAGEREREREKWRGNIMADEKKEKEICLIKKRRERTKEERKKNKKQKRLDNSRMDDVWTLVLSVSCL